MALSDVQFHKPNQPTTVPLMVQSYMLYFRGRKIKHVLSHLIRGGWIGTMYAQESISMQCMLNNQPYSYIFM